MMLLYIPTNSGAKGFRPSSSFQLLPAPAEPRLLRLLSVPLFLPPPLLLLHLLEEVPLLGQLRRVSLAPRISLGSGRVYGVKPQKTCSSYGSTPLVQKRQGRRASRRSWAKLGFVKD